MASEALAYAFVGFLISAFAMILAVLATALYHDAPHILAVGVFVFFGATAILWAGDALE